MNKIIFSLWFYCRQNVSINSLPAIFRLSLFVWDVCWLYRVRQKYFPRNGKALAWWRQHCYFLLLYILFFLCANLVFLTKILGTLLSNLYFLVFLKKKSFTSPNISTVFLLSFLTNVFFLSPFFLHFDLFPF